VQITTTLILARECGVDVDSGTYDRAMKYFFRFAGTGGVAYGDHHPLLYLGDNGKTGMLAAALLLLDRPGVQMVLQKKSQATMTFIWIAMNFRQGVCTPLGAWRSGYGPLIPPKEIINDYHRMQQRAA